MRRRLSGFDAQFVYHERPAETQHTLKLAFLEPPSGQRAPHARALSFYCETVSLGDARETTWAAWTSG